MRPDHLENEIDELRELDHLRTRVYYLRDEGLKALFQAQRSRIDASKSRTSTRSTLDRSIDNSWSSMRDEPNDHIQPALQFSLARQRFVQDSLGSKPEFIGITEQQKDTLTNLSIQDLFDDLDGQLPFNARCHSGDLTRRTAPHRSRVEIFQAARVFQALSRMPATILSRASMLAYYRVIRELYSVDAPNWMIGGARATTGGFPTAFMTGECTRAIQSFANALENTSHMVRLLLDRADEFLRLRNLMEAPACWRAVEIKRATLATYNALTDLGDYALFELPKAELRTLVEFVARANFSTVIEATEFIEQHGNHLKEFLIKVSDSLSNACKAAANSTADAIREITNFHNIESTVINNTKNTDALARINLSHSTALHSIETAKSLSDYGIKASKSFKSFIDDPHSKSDKQEIQSYLAELDKAAERVQKVFSPAKSFIESVLDREIERGKSGRANLGELVFAATTFVCIANPHSDSRVLTALQIVFETLSRDGEFRDPGHLDTDSHGYSLLLLESEVHRALAVLIGRTNTEIPLVIVRHMLEYFEKQAVRYPEGGQLTGWCHDMPRHPRKASSWTTALSLLALDQFGRTLDKVINERVYRHFAVVRSGPVTDRSLSLSRLAYPDHGLATFGMENQHSETRGQSVAYFMERMRTHVLGLPSVYEDKCYSTLLFGPPGTGKTTLLEALAFSCRVPLVNITSSDFLVEGESFIERRTRVIFEALAMLTESVIIFDEFDPMVRSRRSETENGSRNVFSFLTPGLLPKLKHLNQRAKANRVAYSLVTNRIGTLDDAAIRTGRFDYKIGIFPPDLISRIGHVANCVQFDKRNLAEIEFAKLRLIIERTRGRGMTTLGKKGNFRPSADYSTNSILGFLTGKSTNFEPGERDADIDTLAQLKTSANAWDKIEFNEWNWIEERDNSLHECSLPLVDYNALKDAVEELAAPRRTTN